ncbi:hypothetical protein GCM10009578_027070 [Streptomyces rhizosphaericus]
MRWGSGAVVLYPGILLDSNGMDSSGMDSSGMDSRGVNSNGICGFGPWPGSARMSPPGQRVKHSRVPWSCPAPPLSPPRGLGHLVEHQQAGRLDAAR